VRVGSALTKLYRKCNAGVRSASAHAVGGDIAVFPILADLVEVKRGWINCPS